MDYFGPDAFHSPHRRTRLAPFLITGVIATGALTAFIAPHVLADSSVPAARAKPAVSRRVTPPGTHHVEPADGGALPQMGGSNDETSGPWVTAQDDKNDKKEKPGPAPAEKTMPPWRSAPTAPDNRPTRPAPAPVAPGSVQPVSGYFITAPYGQPGPWAAGHHTGVDLAVPVGTRVVAVHAGTVQTAAYEKSYGNYILIHQSDGLYALYAHLSGISVGVGQQVRAGLKIGLSGATGNVTGPHLHFEMRTTPMYGSDIDPVAYLRAHGVSL